MKNIVLFNSNMQQQGSTCVPKNFEKNLVLTCQRCLLPSALLTMPAALLTGSRRECLPSSLPKSVSHRVHNPRTWCATWTPCSLLRWTLPKSVNMATWKDTWSDYPSSPPVFLFFLFPVFLFFLICVGHPHHVFRTESSHSACFIWDHLCVLSTVWCQCHMESMGMHLTLNTHYTCQWAFYVPLKVPNSRITTSVSTEVVNQSTTQTELT